ncbi:2-succinyl-5-enolpyruvyl-6-hydroxy-3-cyclohexene-1-carboxylic-acid synthase [Thermoleophilum album]|uniref:2-succinyl-5-enolpyruvyl-6-hydroxy-3-cyclohexene-1-carboxylate synthase n=1 Tax=Thermoleophilum album TaxID=29539 RepID=A0A1H6FYN6_THEAL|nr:2-succinyl-5-enolpyruvyl-6-hydroxy-3-cyclohexene-1-carboxylic-acid synthase [Thermoleophilum album]SEH14904.1 2-succinyl-5-enolpyruvyl-6-hydroxy-3-cyclohexene-1-carboxylate synthase [Thermoleophilum album]
MSDRQPTVDEPGVARRWLDNPTYEPLIAFADELARLGLALAVTSPGSRNAPIALSLAGTAGVPAISVLDERCAGFFAVGAARASARPAAVTVTSGTAAANLHPAVAEAAQGNVPLLLLTADRPPELRETGAGQAIDQLGLFGSAVRWFVEVGNHPPGSDALLYHRSLACRAYARTLAPRPGPVHLNFPLREPLAPAPAPTSAPSARDLREGRPLPAAWQEVALAPPTPPSALVERLAGRLHSVERGLVICGHLAASADAARAIAALAAQLGWPLLAEPTSGLRLGAHVPDCAVHHYDLLLSDDGLRRALAPELVLRFGETPTSKPLRAALSEWPQIVCDPWLAWHEPTRRAELVVASDPHALASALLAALADQRRISASARTARPLLGNARNGWLARWRAADAAVAELIADHLRRCLTRGELDQPAVAATLADALGDGALLWLSSSLPIREVEAFARGRRVDVAVLANRGANGIDGVVSSCAGAALASGRRPFLLIGELALLHDLGGLVAARAAGVAMTVVCVDNGGGGIFDFLPVAEHTPRDLYERHVATPHPLDFEAIARLADLPLVEAREPQQLLAALREPSLIRVRSERPRNRLVHRELRQRAASVARRALGI